MKSMSRLIDEKLAARDWTLGDLGSHFIELGYPP